MRVLVGCEFSGTVRDAFLAHGHDAWSCDLLPSESPKGPHLQCDVRDALRNNDWDLFIVHPDCTYLTNSGVRWLHTRPERWAQMRQAAAFFRDMLTTPFAPRVAAENPIMHRYAIEIIGRRQNQVIQPWQFGHLELKATCFWLRNLPKLEPTDIVGPPRTAEERRAWARVHREPPSPERWKNRARTFTGIAAAMAEQWGSL